MKKFLLLNILICSCAGHSSIYYFTFDKIDYYHIETEQELLIKLSEGEIYLSKKEKILQQILLGNVPVTLADTSIIKELINVGFKFKNVPIKKLKPFFIVKKDTLAFTSSCRPIYRDILVFQKNNKISGLIKICFDCEKHQIIGASASTLGFGQSGDHLALKKLLQE